MRSEKTHTLAGNECKARMRHRAVRKDTHAGRQRMQSQMRHRAVRKNTHAGLQRMDSANAPSCSQKKHTRWPATNAKRGCVIVRSEKTHTLAGNEWKVRMRHRAVRRNTHAGRQRMQRADTPSCGQKRHTRWLATNRKCGCASVRSEKTHTLAGNKWKVRMRHRACQHPESKKVVFFTVPHPLQLFRCLPQSEIKLGGLLLPHFGQGSRF